MPRRLPGKPTTASNRYLGQYDRVRHCRLHGMDAAQTAHALGCGARLVDEYLAIDHELERGAGRRPPVVAASPSRLDRQASAQTMQQSSRRTGQC